MKNMILILLGTTTILCAAASNANAQGWDKNIAFIPAKNHAAFVSFITEYGYEDTNTYGTANNIFEIGSAIAKAPKASLKALKANNKAFRNFETIYKVSAPDASWSFEDDVMVATFSKENVKTSVVYGKRGNWLHTLTYYQAAKTPQNITSIMDYAYPKDDVKLTVKVEEGGMEFYIVQLENKTMLRKVSVYNGEVNEMEELIKSK